MLPKINPTGTAAWKSLLQHFDEMKEVHMRNLFRSTKNRFQKFSIIEKILF
jgi:glucose-6-phosphate isomerase